jgi:hypothetical protein
MGGAPSREDTGERIYRRHNLVRWRVRSFVNAVNMGSPGTVQWRFLRNRALGSAQWAEMPCAPGERLGSTSTAAVLISRVQVQCFGDGQVYGKDLEIAEFFDRICAVLASLIREDAVDMLRHGAVMWILDWRAGLHRPGWNRSDLPTPLPLPDALAAFALFRSRFYSTRSDGTAMRSALTVELERDSGVIASAYIHRLDKLAASVGNLPVAVAMPKAATVADPPHPPPLAVAGALPADGSPSPDTVAPCVVCLDQPRTVAAVPCGHRHLCKACSAAIDTCPSCRASVSSWLVIYP